MIYPKKFKPITIVKIAHSLIWLMMASAVFYILYSGVSGNITSYTYIALALILLETVVLLFNNWTCPLTDVAQKVKPDWQNGDDIFLPSWVAIHNKTIFGTLFIFGVILVIIRLFLRYQ